MIDRRLIEIFLDVARIEGLSGKERRVADHVRRFLERLGFSATEQEPAAVGCGDAGNVVCEIGEGLSLIHI